MERDFETVVSGQGQLYKKQRLGINCSKNSSLSGHPRGIRLIIATFVCLLLGAAVAKGNEAAGNNDLSPKQKLSYSFGYETGRRMRLESVDIDPDTYSRAFRKGFAGDSGDLTDEEIDGLLKGHQLQMRVRQKEKLAERKRQLADKNKKDGEQFLAVNAGKEGVVTLPSGLQYKVIKKGEGKTPRKTDKVEVRYRGTLVNGTEFENSYRRGKPVVFELDRVIKGWSEALMLMKEGAKWKLYIPSGLAYGSRGAGSKIGPNQTLIFEVELLAVHESQKNTATM